MDVRELTATDEVSEARELLMQLYEDLSERRFERELPAMREQGYRLFGLYVDDTLCSVAGVTVTTNFANGKHVYLNDLVTDETHRSRGYGAELLRFVERWGEERDCATVKLITGSDREEAHEFYDAKMDYRRTGYVFKSEPLGSASTE
jgi:GNAT superfamily N-acetyltransferase